MIRVTFTNDATIEAKDATHLLDAVASMQWAADALTSQSERREYTKANLARRAENWTGQLVDEALPDDVFLTRLAEVGAIKFTTTQPQ